MNDVASSSNPPPPTPVLSSASNLAPGFRFHPTDEELVSYYLKRKVCNLPIRVDAIAEVELYKREPWDLPAVSRLRSRDMEWYFFSPLDRKYSNRSRTNRATAQGYWKTTGKDRAVRSGERGERVVGMKKTLVFHSGRAPRGERTNWVMHEYRLEDENLAVTGVPQDAYVVCRIFQKSGSGPRNGAQYGAPFVEEEWEEAGDLVVAMADAGDSGDSGETGDEENVDVTSVRGAIPVAVGGENGYLQLSDFENKYDQGIQCENNGILAISSDGLNNSNNSEDPIFLVADEIFQGQGFTYGMGVSGLQDVQASYNGMGGNANLALQYHSHASENDGYVEVNDIIDTVKMEYPSTEDTVKMEYPSTEDSFGFYIGTSADRQIPMNQADETINFPEIHGNEFFDAVNGNAEPHDIFEMNSGPDLFLEPDEFLNDLPGDYLPEDNMLFYDAPTNDEPLLEDNFLQMHDLYSPPADDSNGLNVDDLMAYFDCTENNLHYSTEESLEKCLYSPSSNESVAKVEGSTVPTVTSHSLTSAVDEGASSSSRLPQPDNLSNDMTEKGVVATDSQKTDGSDMSFPKRLASMLGSFSAPPALAAESPGPRGKSFGPASSSSPVGSVHVTAGVIQIHGYNMMGRAEHWSSSQKHGDMGLLLSFGVARNVFGKSEDYEPVPKVQGWSMSVVLRGGFYLFFLSALFLALSLKVGLHICSR